jgi:hypothetical protein
MTVTILATCILVVNTGFAQFGEIIQKPTQVPDSLTCGQAGFIYISYFVDDAGKIFSWELSRISVWDSVARKYPTVYGVDPKFMEWSENESKFVPVIKAKLHTKNTPLGKKLYRALIGWLTQFTKETEFKIADSSLGNPFKSTKKRYASTYSAQLEFGRRSR